MSETPSSSGSPRAPQMFSLVDAHTAPENLKSAGGCGCGGHGGGHGHGGCGCGGHGHGHGGGHGAQGRPTDVGIAEGGAAQARRFGGEVEELEVHALPKVVRHALLFHAMDALPVGENIRILAPHEPRPLFEHLQNSESHYRVEPLEEGPVEWRYRITRLS